MDFSDDNYTDKATWYRQQKQLQLILKLYLLAANGPLDWKAISDRLAQLSAVKGMSFWLDIH